MSSKTPNLFDLGEQSWAERHKQRPEVTKGWETAEAPVLGGEKHECAECGRAWDFGNQAACLCGSHIIRTTPIPPTPLVLEGQGWATKIKRAVGLEPQVPAVLSPALRDALAAVIPAAAAMAVALEHLEVAIGEQATEGWSDVDRRWLGRLQLGCGSAHGGDVSRESLSLPLSAPLKALVMMAAEPHPEPR